MSRASSHPLQPYILLAAALGLLTLVTGCSVRCPPETGLASWYGPGYRGKPTASGEPFRPARRTAAHRTLALGTKVRVTHIGTGRTVVVRINDRGPFIDGRIIDLSRGAARRLGMLEEGVAQVRVDILDACPERRRREEG